MVYVITTMASQMRIPTPPSMIHCGLASTECCTISTQRYGMIGGMKKVNPAGLDISRQLGIRIQHQCVRRKLSVKALGNAQDPPDVPKPRSSQPQGGREWLQSILSRFGPVREKASNTTVLDFEKPLVELDNRIKEVSLLVLFCSYEVQYLLHLVSTR